MTIQAELTALWRTRMDMEPMSALPEMEGLSISGIGFAPDESADKLFKWTFGALASSMAQERVAIHSCPWAIRAEGDKLWVEVMYPTPALQDGETEGFLRDMKTGLRVIDPNLPFA